MLRVIHGKTRRATMSSNEIREIAKEFSRGSFRSGRILSLSCAIFKQILWQVGRSGAEVALGCARLRLIYAEIKLDRVHLKLDHT